MVGHPGKSAQTSLPAKGYAYGKWAGEVIDDLKYDKISLFGGSFGAGNYGMAGRAYSPRLLFMWPNAKISVMGGEQAASVLATVKEDQYKYKGLEVPKDEIAQLKKEILAKYDYEGSAFYSTARLWDDGIIDPIDTRKILALGIAASLNQPFPQQQFGVFRM